MSLKILGIALDIFFVLHFLEAIMKRSPIGFFCAFLGSNTSQEEYDHLLHSEILILMCIHYFQILFKQLLFLT